MICHLQILIILAFISLVLCDYELQASDNRIVRNIILKEKGIVLKPLGVSLGKCEGPLTFSYEPFSGSCLLEKIEFTDQKKGIRMTVRLFEPDNPEPTFIVPIAGIVENERLELTREVRRIAEKKDIIVGFDVSTIWKDLKTSAYVIVSAMRLEFQFTMEAENKLAYEGFESEKRTQEKDNMIKLMNLKSVKEKSKVVPGQFKEILTLPPEQFSWAIGTYEWTNKINKTDNINKGTPVIFSILPGIEEIDDFSFTVYLSLEPYQHINYFTDLMKIKRSLRGGKKRHFKKKH
jgi:hypothetical protein